MIYSPLPEYFQNPIYLASWYDSILSAFKDGFLAIWEWVIEALTWLVTNALGLMFDALPIDWQNTLDNAIVQALPTWKLLNLWVPANLGLELLVTYIAFYIVYLPVSYLIKLL